MKLSTLSLLFNAAWSTFTSVDVPVKGVEKLRWATRRVRKGAAVFVDPWTHLRIAKVLDRPEVRPVVTAAPWIAFKYLGDYLRTGLTRRQRAAILVHHYSLLISRTHGDFFRAVVEDRLEIWREVVDDHLHQILLAFPRDTHAEGDLALVFRADDVDLYTLSFTCGPGDIAGLSVPDVMFIAQVQGKGGAFESIRDATKRSHDISPANLLLSAAEGVAMALGVTHIIGISASTHLSVEYTRPRGLATPYDQFWLAAGGRWLAGDMFALPVPLEEKGILEIKRCHRSRARRKRAFRRSVSEQARARFQAEAMRDSAGRGEKARMKRPELALP